MTIPKKEMLSLVDMQILQLFCKGFEDEEIGTALNRSRHAIKARIQSIRTFWNCHNRVALVTMIFQKRILDIDTLEITPELKKMLELMSPQPKKKRDVIKSLNELSGKRIVNLMGKDE